MRFGGASAEWTLGAYLHLLNHDGNNAGGAEAAPDGGSWYVHPTHLVAGARTASLDSGMLYSDVAILVGALVSLAFCARMVVKRSWISTVSYHAKEVRAKAVGRMAPTRTISMPIRTSV